MYNSIEIPDSDEDVSEPTIDLPKLESSAAEINEHTPKKQRKISVSSATETNAATTPGSTSSEITNSSPLNSTNSSKDSKDNNQHTTHQVRQRSRKAQLTVRNGLENEIQFETIPVDDETPSAQEQRVKENESLHTLIANMLNTDEIETVVQRIANERVRCNFLLTSYHVSNINN